MGIKASIDGGGKDFEAVAEMIQPAVLADIVDKGMVDNKFKPGTKQHKCYFVWILAEEDSENRNKRVFESFTVSLHEKSSLRKRLKNMGIEIAPGQEFDLDTLIGTVRTLVLSQEDGEGGKTFTRVTATMPLQKGQKAVAIPDGFIRKQDSEGYTAPAVKKAPAKPAPVADEDIPF